MDKNNVPMRSSLMPSENEEPKPVPFKNSVKRNRIGDPESTYSPSTEQIDEQKEVNELSNKEEMDFQVALNEYQTGRTMIGVQRMQKVEYDALLELYSDQYAYNYELLGAMLDQMINNLSREQRLEFQDIVQKKKQRLASTFRKGYKK